MAKEKFDRNKPHVNVGTKLLLIITATFALSLNLVAKESISFDFDNPQFNYFDLIEYNSSENAFQLPESNVSISKGIIEVEKGMITQAGKEIRISPSLNPDGSKKAYYKFKPSSDIYWRARCGTKSGYYTVCATYKFYPKYGGHEHSENIPGYTWQGSGNTVPIRSCAYNRPVNTTVTWYVKTPEFATRSEETIEYFGACSGVHRDIVDIKIDGLKPLKPASEDSLHGGATYYDLVGETLTHKINHFGKPQTITLLKEIAWQYHIEFPTAPVLCVNDMSLRWGGLFDHKADWQSPHDMHRYGRQADLRIWTIPPENRERFKEIACKKYGVEVQLHKGLLPLEMEETDFSWIPCDSKLADDFDKKYKTPHYHLKFPKFDNIVESPPDETPRGCP